MSVSPEAKSELRWWINNIVGANNILTRESPTTMLTTDASKLGLGAMLATQSTGGLRSSTERQKQINYLDFLAVFLDLQSFCSSKHDCHVRLMIDHTTAVATATIAILVRPIAGKCNIQADLESHHSVTETDWMLNNTLLSKRPEQARLHP